MNDPTFGRLRRVCWVAGAILLGAGATAQESPTNGTMTYDADSTALVVARRYL